ncbi:MAG: helix-turn-helix transcriptional regulator [Clostridia bacterium]|nr:helix-turn-helix transcriptional regulator [Clostridia bacterium]
MPEHVREIAERLGAMRDISGFSVEELCLKLNLSAEEYIRMESGEVDIPISVLCEAADIFGVSVTEFLTGDRAKCRMYSVVRKDRGIGVERTAGYDYTALAYGFAQRRVEPLMVTVEPKADGAPLHLNSHSGQEFHYVLEGKMSVHIGGKSVDVSEGDSLYFDSSFPHAMIALEGKPAKLLVVVIK